MQLPRVASGRRSARLSLLLAILAILICSWAYGWNRSQLALAQEPYAVVIERGVAAKMRDGVALYADVYRPRADGKFPVLLTRTPYDKSNNTGICMRAVAAGYVCVSQDVRGRWSSEGEWYPFKYESQDGYDTVEWLAHQPWSTGVIGMFGASYVGATQMLAALARPPHLAGLFPIITASNYHENWTYQGGAFEQWFGEEWTSGLTEDTLRRRVNGMTHVLDSVNTLPLSNYPPIVAPDAKDIAPYFRDWLAHPNYDDYWKQWAIDADYSRINVPAYHVGAWYDIFLGGTIRNYQGLKAGAGNFFAKENQRMIIEIGGHAGGGRKIGDVDFGADAPWDETALMLRWYDYLFKDAKNGLESEKRVRVFTMGTNVWRNFDDWPPAGAEPRRYFLHSNGNANGSAGDGALNGTAPSAETADKFTYDPSNPVQTRGGSLCCNNNLLAAGPKDQTDLEPRRDILVYTSAPLEQALDVTGPVSVELFAESSAVDTDFTAKLVDLWPNGYSQNLTDGILRMRYHDGTQKAPEKIVPGRVYKITIDLWATSNVFLPGHRIRVDISSSNYPRFDRNLNTGDPDIAHATQKVIATNTVLHDADHPSAIVLSVLPAGK